MKTKSRIRYKIPVIKLRKDEIIRKQRKNYAGMKIENHGEIHPHTHILTNSYIHTRKIDFR